jgi:hypothetical protein
MGSFFGIYIPCDQDSNLRQSDRDAYLSFSFAQNGQLHFWPDQTKGIEPAKVAEGGLTCPVSSVGWHVVIQQLKGHTFDSCCEHLFLNIIKILFN